MSENEPQGDFFDSHCNEVNVEQSNTFSGK